MPREVRQLSGRTLGSGRLGSTHWKLVVARSVGLVGGGAKEARVEEAEDEDENEAEEKDEDEPAQIPCGSVPSAGHYLCLGPGRAEEGGGGLGWSG